MAICLILYFLGGRGEKKTINEGSKLICTYQSFNSSADTVDSLQYTGGGWEGGWGVQEEEKKKFGGMRIKYLKDTTALLELRVICLKGCGQHLPQAGGILAVILCPCKHKMADGIQQADLRVLHSEHGIVGRTPLHILAEAHDGGPGKASW